MNTDPVRERAKLEDILRAQSLANCLERITELIDELQAAVDTIDREQAAMTPEVQELLGRAASDAGVPLADVTEELVAALKEAGVLDDLVVRRA